MKMIVTDLDKTLLRSDKTISEYTQSVLKKCHENGVLVVFATARPERATREWQAGSVSYVIANDGATITRGEEILLNIAIPEDIKHSIIKRFTAEKEITGICVETGDVLYGNDNNYFSWTGTYPLDTGWNLVYHDFRTPIAEEVCKISVECGDSDIVKCIARDFPELHVSFNGGEDWRRITHKSASKYNALAYLSQLTHIALKDVAAFGDDYNDVEMLEQCGVGVAVDNAVTAAKEAADVVCGANDDDGVAKYIDKYILAEMGVNA